MLASLVSAHYITVFMIILVMIKLYAQQKSRDVDLRFYWTTVICCLLLVFEDCLESFTALYPELRFWRILFSVAGYVLRPTAAIGMLLVVCPPAYRSWKIWIPWYVNLAVNLTAFFSPVAFSFDENYGFVRGPLGCVVFIVAFLYMMQTLVMIWKRFYEGKTAERWILILCVIGCMVSSLVDSLYGGVHLNEAMMISSIFLFMFLRSHDNYLDPLTSLRNRFAFYDDIGNLERDVTAVASLDMNGLKALNDSRGHAAGDRALAAIGARLNGISGRNTMTYRVGGDEFVALFMRQDEETVRQKLQRVREEIEGLGISVSAGYAMRTEYRDLEEVLHESDRNMYKNKTEYYRKKGIDRRRQADNR